MVNSEFTNLHLKDFPLHLCSYTKGHDGGGGCSAEYLALSKHSVVAVGGVISIHYHYDHSTNSLQLLYFFLGRLFRSVWAYHTRVD